MSRATWKGTLSFGMLSIPVELFPTEKSHSIDFDLLDERDMSPVGYKRVNKTTGKEVTHENIVKGYEVEKNTYVLVDERDFENANVAANQNLEVLSFVDPAAISPLHFEKAYFIEPNADTLKPYLLLLRALEKSGKVGIGTVVFHGREHLGAVLAWNKALYFEVLRFSQQLKTEAEMRPKSFEGKFPPLKPQEVELAVKLVESMSAEWRAEDFRDTYVDDLMKLIRKKAETGESEPANVPKKEGEDEGAQVIDLLAVLKKSLAARGKKGGARASGPSAAAGKRGADGKKGQAGKTSASDKADKGEKSSTRKTAKKQSGTALQAAIAKLKAHKTKSGDRAAR